MTTAEFAIVMFIVALFGYGPLIALLLYMAWAAIAPPPPTAEQAENEVM